MSNMLEFSPIYRPFSYPWAVEITTQHEQMHWTENEVPMGEDVGDWKGDKLSNNEKSFITQILRMFTTADVDVGAYYNNILIPKFKNNELRMMMNSFANREGTHQRAYALLNDTLGLPESEYATFLNYTEMKDKHEFMLAADPNTRSGLGLALAKGVFNEGVSLFASFVMLLHFQQRGLMKGMAKVVEWSIKDECYSRDTQILTNHGWKLFPNLKPEDLVAQFNMETHVTDFVKPSNYSRHWHNGDMIHFHADEGWVDFCVTPNHDMVVWNESNGVTKKVKAEEFKKHSRIHLPTASKIDRRGAGLTPHERFLIAFQADGAMPSDRYSGSICGCLPASFSGLRKLRKIERLREIIAACGYEYSESPQSDGDTHIRVKVPLTNLLTKNFIDWNIDLNQINYEWACEFIGEIAHWDGHLCCDEDGDETGRVLYGTTNERNAEFVQMIGSLCGWRTKITPTPDDRKESYQTYYRLSMIPNRHWSRTGRLKTERVAYNDEVFCVTVPTGALVTRRNGIVGISGNTKHVDGISMLFRAYCQAFPNVVNDKFKTSIYQMARDVVKLEDAFIDLAYDSHEIEGLKAEDVKSYIRYIADRRLTQLGLKENFSIKENPLPWLDWIVSATRHANFFESKPTEYEVAGLQDEWSYEEQQTFTIYTREGCSYCTRAKELMVDRGLQFVEIDMTNDDYRAYWFSSKEFEASNWTLPKIYVGNTQEYIGGFTEFVTFLDK
jgi:ribonucleotide reductase beta subunit family protein with ferritin-like domain/glutaredoxin